MTNSVCKALFLSLFVLIQLNCFSQFNDDDKDQLVHQYDEFKKVNTTRLTIHSKSEEVTRGLLSTISKYTLKSNFYKTQFADETVTCSFSLVVSELYEPLENEAFINIDGQIYPLEVEDVAVHTATDIEESTTGIGDDKRITGITTENTIIYNGTIYIPYSIFTQVHTGSDVAIRMYLDYEKVTFKFSGSEVKLLEQFIQTL